MFRYAVTAALENISQKAPVILRGDIENCAKRAAADGYDALELHLKNPKKYNGLYLKSVADKYGIEFAGIATGMEYTVNGLSLIADDPEVRKKAVERLKEHIDLAKILDCLVVIGIMRSNIPDFTKRDIYETYLSDCLKELAVYAEQNGVMLVLEPITRYINNYLNTVQETTDFIQKINSPNLLVHLDTHSMNIEDVNLADSVRYCGKMIGYVHFSDSNRMYPGGGHVDFKKFLEALIETDYKGYISMECLPLPDEDTCSKKGLKYIKELENQIEKNI